MNFCEHGRPPALFSVWVLVAALCGGFANPAWARVGGTVPDPRPLEERLPHPLVERMQKALAAIDLYKGPVDGILGPKTEDAIRTFQRRTGIRPDGIVTKGLVESAETAPQVNSLLERLDQARERKTEAARQALLSHPATRNLLGSGGAGGAGGEVADPTRDASSCFRTPTAGCLLAEAAESAKAIHKDDMRDWALGEILAAQAKAGMTREAMVTVSRIHDPRLIMAALRSIAEGQAAAGRMDDALAAAGVIPDALKRAEALAAIAAIQAKNGDSEGARQAAHQLVGALKDIEQTFKRVAFHAQAAAVLVRNGDGPGGRANLQTAQALARSAVTAEKRGAALRHVAAALAEMGEPGQALDILKDVGDDSDRTSVLVAAATAEADAGNTAGARAIADTIEAARYRAVVLSRIAVAQATAVAVGGDGIEDARRTIDEALAITKKIRFPYARSFAGSHIAMALMEIGRMAGGGAFEQAVEAARKIKDDPLRAQTLWTIAAEMRISGDEAGAEGAETLAREATEDIKSRISRVWMFGDFALNRAAFGEMDAAWDAFHAGLKVAEGINNAWGRARVLGKLASTLTELIRVGETAEAPAP